jgi:hypothetical protein
MSVSSDEVNFLVYRYLQESGTFISYRALHNCTSFEGWTDEGQRRLTDHEIGPSVHSWGNLLCRHLYLTCLFHADIRFCSFRVYVRIRKHAGSKQHPER